jgi:predicted HicB family RNase H-like nuclease
MLMKDIKSIRINPEVLYLAKIEAVKAKKTLGAWLEEAINEKIERSNKADKTGS